MAGIGSYSVGFFLSPAEDDRTFSDVTAARVEAKRMSSYDSLTAFAVWHRDELDRVFLRGYELEPVPF